ncbi:protein-tyrosine-phosphatase [Rubripirellula tenax]|uniref:protein-tyrosine-phosphatase n=1 Tax=Rubripirellula tenax TaxID=2528015 RepID=UPI001FE88A01|nr:protein-tyrosine-phosphatase [Rubripirellula tenax]
MSFHSPLKSYIDARMGEFDQIPVDRRAELADFAKRIQAGGHDGVRKLNFICTHNSRRSHLAQIWATVAAQHFGVDGIETFSGGTEATAMNSRIVDTLRRSGLSVSTNPGPAHTNPLYKVAYSDSDVAPAVECFSKVYDQSPNPSEDFIAVMVCSNADTHCPIVRGASDRIVIKYDDPKVSDDTVDESVIYDARCGQIAREMLYAFSLL